MARPSNFMGQAVAQGGECRKFALWLKYWLVNHSYSLPEEQAGKLVFFTWTLEGRGWEVNGMSLSIPYSVTFCRFNLSKLKNVLI